MSKDPVIVYTSHGCVYCARLKQWLTEKNVPFEERNVEDNPAYFDELHARGIFTSPVVLVGDQPVVGFRPNKLAELLGV